MASPIVLRPIPSCRWRIARQVIAANGRPFSLPRNSQCRVSATARCRARKGLQHAVRAPCHCHDRTAPQGARVIAPATRTIQCKFRRAREVAPWAIAAERGHAGPRATAVEHRIQTKRGAIGVPVLWYPEMARLMSQLYIVPGRTRNRAGERFERSSGTTRPAATVARLTTLDRGDWLGIIRPPSGPPHTQTAIWRLHAESECGSGRGRLPGASNRIAEVCREPHCGRT